MDNHLWLVAPIAREIHEKFRRRFDVEDLCSAGFLGLLRAAAQPEKARDFAVYVRYKIRGAILDSIKGLPLRESRHHTIDSFEPPTAEPEYLGFATLIAPLPPKLRGILVCRYAAGMTNAEVAKRLKIPPQSAKLLHRQAIAALRLRSKLKPTLRAKATS